MAVALGLSARSVYAAPPPAAEPAPAPAAEPALAPVAEPAPASVPTVEPVIEPELRRRPIRSGVVPSLSLESALGSAFGYPNDAKLLGDDRYYGRTGAVPGFGFTLALSGALAEYLNVGLYVASAGYGNEQWSVSSTGFGVRFDAFPLTYGRWPWLRHWAVYGLAGLGITAARYQAEGRDVADLEGTQSQLGLGSFYEFRFGALGLGPDVRFDSVFTRTTDRMAAHVGLRLAFYPSALFKK